MVIIVVKKITIKVDPEDVGAMKSGESVELKVDKNEFGVDRLLVFPVFPGTLGALEEVRRAITPVIQKEASLNYIKEANKRKETDTPGVKSKSQIDEDKKAPRFTSAASDVELTMGEYLAGKQEDGKESAE